MTEREKILAALVAHGLKRAFHAEIKAAYEEGLVRGDKDGYDRGYKRGYNDGLLGRAGVAGDVK